MRNSTETYVTVHVRLDRNYVRAMDSIGGEARYIKLRRCVRGRGDMLS